MPRRIGAIALLLCIVVWLTVHSPIGGRTERAEAAQEAAPSHAPAQAADAGLLNHGLSMLPLLSTARTRSVCAENPTGGKGQGGAPCRTRASRNTRPRGGRPTTWGKAGKSGRSCASIAERPQLSWTWPVQE